VVGYYNAGDRMKYWGKIVTPGVGSVVVAGPLVVGIDGALEGAVVVSGLSALQWDLTASASPRPAS